jgi:hypothetical protein
MRDFDLANRRFLQVLLSASLFVKIKMRLHFSKRGLLRCMDFYHCSLCRRCLIVVKGNQPINQTNINGKDKQSNVGHNHETYHFSYSDYDLKQANPNHLMSQISIYTSGFISNII